MFSFGTKINPNNNNDDTFFGTRPQRWKRKGLSTTRKKSTRFIPNRNTRFETGKYISTHRYDDEKPLSLYHQQLKKSMFDSPNSHQIIKLIKNPPKPREFNKNNILFKKTGVAKKRKFRKVDQTPKKVLDAPDLRNDFYTNNLDWGSNGIVSIGLEGNVYLWNSETGDIATLNCCEDTSYVSSVKFSFDGQFLAAGNTNSIVQVWDLHRQTLVRTMQGHSARVSVLSWNNHLLASAGRDSKVLNHDVRKSRHVVTTMTGHKGEVCGLQWSPTGMQLASGANDNKVKIWQKGYKKETTTFYEHTAAVKAIAWNPGKNSMLVTGGGTACKKLYIWNAYNGKVKNCINAESQISGIVFSPCGREMVTSHGFSFNQLALWKYPSLIKFTELQGHTARVLHTAASPDGTQVCTAGADETLRFWEVFSEMKKEHELNDLSKFGIKDKRNSMSPFGESQLKRIR